MPLNFASMVERYISYMRSFGRDLSQKSHVLMAWLSGDKSRSLLQCSLTWGINHFRDERDIGSVLCPIAFSCVGLFLGCFRWAQCRVISRKCSTWQSQLVSFAAQAGSRREFAWLRPWRLQRRLYLAWLSEDKSRSLFQCLTWGINL